MKIVLVGVCDDPESTNFHQVNALRQLGHDVLPFNYRAEANKASQGGDIDGAAGVYRALVEASDPDLVIYSKFDTWPSEAIEWTKKRGILTWYWYMDPLLFLTKDLVNHAQAADFASCTGLGQTQYLRFMGANAYHIFEGIDPEVYKPLAPIPDLITDVGFIGAHTNERLALVRKVRETGVDVTVSGPGWSETGGHVMDAEFFSLLSNSSLLMLGCDREQHTIGYFSDRVFRVMACGGVYVSRRIPSMERWFTNGQHLFLFDTDEELAQFCFKTAEEKNQFPEVRKAARQHVMENFTWCHSMERLIGVANGTITDWEFDLAYDLVV